MSTLTAALQRVLDLLPAEHAHIVGPPFTHPPAAPCYVIELPQIVDVVGCAVATASVDVVCVPQTGTDQQMLLGMADAVIGAAGALVTGGAAEPNPYTDQPDVWTYRLTLEL